MKGKEDMTGLNVDRSRSLNVFFGSLKDWRLSLSPLWRRVDARPSIVPAFISTATKIPVHTLRDT